jgi:hypothetical protein
MDKSSALFKRARSLPANAHFSPEAEFLTRLQAATFLTERGFPISEQLLSEFGMAVNRHNGPRIAGTWGRRILYRPADLLAWARARLQQPDQQQPSPE